MRQRLAPADSRNILDFLDAAEYGLAFETLLFCIVEENAPISTTFCALMQDAANRMNYPDDFSELRDPDMAAALALVWEACRDRAE